MIARGVKSLKLGFHRLGVSHRDDTGAGANETLKVYGGPEVSTGASSGICAARLPESFAQADMDKLEDTYDKKLDAIESKIKRQEMEVEEAER